MNETTIGYVILYGTPVLLVIIAIVVFIIKQNKDYKIQMKLDAQKRRQAAADEKEYFEKNGCELSKRIGKLLIDHVHKKWMIAGERAIYNYSDVTSIRVREEKDSQFVSIYVDIGLNDVLNPVIILPILTNFSYEGSAGFYTSLKNTAVEQEAFFKAVIAENNNSQV